MDQNIKPSYAGYLYNKVYMEVFLMRGSTEVEMFRHIHLFIESDYPTQEDTEEIFYDLSIAKVK